VTIRSSACNFLFDFNRNHASILYRFRDMASYLSKVADFNPPHLHLVPPQGFPSVEFPGGFWRQKTRVPWLSSSVVCLILSLSVLVENRLVTDRQTDRHRQTQAHNIYRASIASRGTNKIQGPTSNIFRKCFISSYFFILRMVTYCIMLCCSTVVPTRRINIIIIMQ